MFTIMNDESIRCDMETYQDLLPDLEFWELSDYFIELTAKLISKCDSQKSMQNDNELVMQIL